jgi:hypothetical protein
MMNSYENIPQITQKSHRKNETQTRKTVFIPGIVIDISDNVKDNSAFAERKENLMVDLGNLIKFTKMRGCCIM